MHSKCHVVETYTRTKGGSFVRVGQRIGIFQYECSVEHFKTACVSVGNGLVTVFKGDADDLSALLALGFLGRRRWAGASLLNRSQGLAQEKGRLVKAAIAKESHSIEVGGDNRLEHVMQV